MKKLLICFILLASLCSVYAYEKNIYKEELKERGWLYGCTPANMSLAEPIRGGFNFAVMNGETEIMDLEVKAGLDITKCGDSLPNMAIWKKQPEALDLLLKNGFNPNKIYIDHSYLTFAIYRKNPEAVQVLIDNGADVNLIAKGKHPLNSAIKKKQPEIVKMLLNAGAKPDEKTIKLVDKSKNDDIKNLFKITENSTQVVQKTNKNPIINNTIDTRINELRNILLIEVSKFSVGNYAGGHRCSVNFYNTSNKDIKYITLYLTYYNKVDDPIYNEISDLSSFGVRHTGVLNAKHETHALWDNVVYNKQVVNNAKVNSIKIEYMDGSKYEFKPDDIKYVVKYNDLLQPAGENSPIININKLLKNW